MRPNAWRRDSSGSDPDPDWDAVFRDDPPTVASPTLGTPGGASRVTQPSARLRRLAAGRLAVPSRLRAGSPATRTRTRRPPGRTPLYLARGTVVAGITSHLALMAAFRSIDITSVNPFAGSIAWAWIAIATVLLTAVCATAALVVAGVRRLGRLAVTTLASMAVIVAISGMVVQSEIVALQREVTETYIENPTALVDRARVIAGELGLSRDTVEEWFRGLVD